MGAGTDVENAGTDMGNAGMDAGTDVENAGNVGTDMGYAGMDSGTDAGNIGTDVGLQEQEQQDSLEEKVVRLLQERHFTITTAESCTGGLIAGTLVNVAGASDVLNEAYVTYSNEAKQRLAGVRAETLEQFGAVSEETACEMAAGAARAAEADVALSSTGIAGPGGGTPEKPVGLVYIACCVRGKVRAGELHFHGDRMQNRMDTVKAALGLAAEMLTDGSPQENQA